MSERESMDIEARDQLNNNHSHSAHLQNGVREPHLNENGATKDIELPLIKRKDGSVDLENGKVPELANGEKIIYEHNEVHEFIEGHGIQPDHSTS